MNLTKFKIICTCTLFVLIASCQKEVTQHPETRALTDGDYIQYGTAFSMCAGYCYQNMTITGSKTILDKKSWFPSTKYPDYSKSKDTDSTLWIQLNESLNMECFMQLDTIIGCPDCADGGAEWIKIKQKDKIHRVVFEYGEAPESIKNLTIRLRACKNSVFE